MDVAHLNELIATFGEHHKAALRAEKRASASSPLFDLLRRSLVGYYLKWDHTAAFLREVAAVLSPEEVGRRMKRPGMRPYYMQHFLLMQDILSGRQQRMLELGLCGAATRSRRSGSTTSLFVADFWERSCRAYRNDGGLFPAARPVAADPRRGRRRRGARRCSSRSTRRPTRRRAPCLATLDGYCVPRPRRAARRDLRPRAVRRATDGTVLFLKEVNDLRNDLMPWAQTTTRNLRRQRRRSPTSAATTRSSATSSGASSPTRSTSPTASSASRC